MSDFLSIALPGVTVLLAVSMAFFLFKRSAMTRHYTPSMSKLVGFFMFGTGIVFILNLVLVHLAPGKIFM